MGTWLLVFVLLGAVIGAWYIWQYYAIRLSTDDAQIDGHISPISSRVGGTILDVLVQDNQRVQAGGILVQIDSRDYKVAVQQAEANLAAAMAAAEAARTVVPVESIATSARLSTALAQLRQAEEGVTASEKEIETARARLTSAEAKQRENQANHTRALQDLERYRLLIAKDEVSQQQYDSAVAAVDATRAQRDSAQALVTEAGQAVGAAQARAAQARALVMQAQVAINQATQAGPQQIEISKSQAGSAEAKVQQAKAALDEAKLRFEYTTITAPVGGLISNKTVQVGQIVQPGQGLLSIIPLEDIWVIAFFKETQLKEIRPGQFASIHVDAYRRSFKGHVESIAAATGERFSLLPPENASGNYVKVVQRVPVKIVIDQGEDPDHLLRIGLSVTPTIFIR
jgi:membrane fusion protein, multidrug efflux system